MANVNDPFVIVRTFDAPRELVFEAWSDPKHMKNWVAPTGFETEYKKADVRTGGLVHYSMTGPGGITLWGKAVYKEVTRPSFLSYVQSFSDENGGDGFHPLAPEWPKDMYTEVRFEAEGNKTKVTLQWSPVNPTAKGAQIFHEGRESMNGGWGGSFAKLDEYLLQMQK